MKNLFFFVLLSSLLFLQSKCGSTVESFPIGTPFELNAESIKVNKNHSLAVEFGQVLEDSRCPTYTNCIWAGQVKVQLIINEKAYELTLVEDDPSAASFFFENYKVKLVAVNPYPEAGKKISPAAYVLELLISTTTP